MVESSDDFAELMDRVRRGDGDALNQILAEYGDAIRREVRFSLLDRRLRSFIGDSDVYQSVVLRFYSRMREGEFRVESPLDLVRLLKGIARTRIAELVRFWHAQRRDLSRNARDDQLGNCQEPESNTDSTEQLERMNLAIAVQQRMTDRDRAVLQYRLDGVNWPEIARRLGAVSGEAVRKQHHRSLARITAQLGRMSQ